MWRRRTNLATWRLPNDDFGRRYQRWHGASMDRSMTPSMVVNKQSHFQASWVRPVTVSCPKGFIAVLVSISHAFALMIWFELKNSPEPWKRDYNACVTHCVYLAPFQNPYSHLGNLATVLPNVSTRSILSLVGAKLRNCLVASDALYHGLGRCPLTHGKQHFREIPTPDWART